MANPTNRVRKARSGYPSVTQADTERILYHVSKQINLLTSSKEGLVGGFLHLHSPWGAPAGWLPLATAGGIWEREHPARKGCHSHQKSVDYYPKVSHVLAPSNEKNNTTCSTGAALSFSRLTITD